MPSYSSIKRKAKRTTDEYVGAKMADTDEEKWMTQSSAMRFNCKLAYTYLCIMMLTGVLAFCEYMLGARVPVEIWITIFMVMVFMNSIVTGTWVGLIMAASRKDTALQTIKQIYSHRLYKINQFFWLLLAIGGTMIVFIVDFSKHDRAIVSSVNDINTQPLPPYIVNVLLWFLLFDMVIGICAFLGLIVHAIEHNTSRLSARPIDFSQSTI